MLTNILAIYKFRPAAHGPLLFVLAAYLVVTFLLIIAGGGLPYTMDNNETFSSLNHARNLWTFDFSSSKGLADEALSPEPAAHPVVHSHQGNFPRLFSFALYGLGAQSAESQILITALTIGTASIALGFFFFKRMAGTLFATIAMLMLITDYLMFAQWQVNTYRVWHCFFFFGAFLSVYGYAEWKRPFWISVTIMLYACLFYWEFSFAFFTALSAGLYALWLYRNSLRALVVIAAAQGVGATLAILVLVIQLVSYLGWADFVTDIRLTHIARNFAPDHSAFLARLREFYDTQNLVFLYNVQGSYYLNPVSLVRSVFRFTFQVSTPWLSSMMGMLAVSALFSDRALPGPKDVKPFARVPSVILLAGGLFSVLLAFSNGGYAITGIGWHPPGFLTGAILLLGALGLAWALIEVTTRISLSGTGPYRRRILVATLFLYCVGAFLFLQSYIYDPAFSVRWQAYSSHWLALILSSMLGAALLGTLLILTGRHVLLGHSHQVVDQVRPYLICGGLAYFAIYCINPGYLHTGYLMRLSPLPVFITQPFLAVGWFVLVAVTSTMLKRWRWPGDQRVRIVVAGVASSLIVVLTAAWFWIQITYLRVAPPNQLAFIRHLQPLKLDGLASNGYAVPFALAARTWGYSFTETLLETSPDVAQYPYMWMADRRTNTRYLTPEIYVCFVGVYALDNVTPGGINTQGCSKNSVVRSAGNGEIIARDQNDDRWAIVRLKWPVQYQER